MVLNGIKWNGIWKLNNNNISELKSGKGYIKKYNNNGVLEFEGEYINGEKNGKGKEYNFQGSLIFEGEYSNGKRQGKGTEYFYFPKIKFIGEYKLDKKWNGKGYDINGNYIYELIDGKGIIKEFNDVGILRYEGSIINGEKNGKGKEYSLFGLLIYEGDFINGQRNGIGKEYDNFGELIYFGNYLKGKRME